MRRAGRQGRKQVVKAQVCPVCQNWVRQGLHREAGMFDGGKGRLLVGKKKEPLPWRRWCLWRDVCTIGGYWYYFTSTVVDNWQVPQSLKVSKLHSTAFHGALPSLPSPRYEMRLNLGDFCHPLSSRLSLCLCCRCSGESGKFPSCSCVSQSCQKVQPALGFLEIPAHLTIGCVFRGASIHWCWHSPAHY